EVNVRVDEPRDDPLALRIDLARVLRDGDLGPRTGGDDAPVLYDDDGVGDGRRARSVDERRARDDERPLGGAYGRGGGERDQRERSERGRADPCWHAPIVGYDRLRR